MHGELAWPVVSRELRRPLGAGNCCIVLFVQAERGPCRCRRWSRGGTWPYKGCTKCQLCRRRRSCSSLWRTSGTARVVGTPGKNRPLHLAFCICTMALSKATGCGCRTDSGNDHARSWSSEACCKQASVSYLVESQWVQQADAHRSHRHEQAWGHRDDTGRRCRHWRAGHRSASRAGGPPGTIGTWTVWGCSPACCRSGLRTRQARSAGMDNGLVCIP